MPMNILITATLGLLLTSPLAAGDQLRVGQPHQGGIIGYIFTPADPGYVAGETHGLIVAASDQGTAVPWYNGRYVITGATGTALGTGKPNTAAIVATQGPGHYAARLCADLEMGGYTDWYLPSKDELDRLYDNKRTIGGLVEQRYWSSSEADVNNAWPQNFANGYQYHLYDKSHEIRVRAVRSF
jgi:hypothetical protein